MFSKRISSFLTAIFMVVCTVAAAQENIVYPQPQQSRFAQQRFDAGRPYRLAGKVPAGAHALLQNFLTINSSATALPIEVLTVDKVTLLQQSGAYQLHLSPQKIEIKIFDDRSFFYAVQTLHQLAQKGSDGRLTLPVVQITDYPDVAYRGTVEGFYGEPWSHQDRIEQLRFYSKLKLNTYLYGPKDDPYHSSPHWRDPYPAEKATQLKELVKEAKKNKVDFVWAIHPGKDIKWNKEDSSAVLHKFELMYGLGVRSFAVFFDDISGAGTDAKKQAGLLNYIQTHFVQTKGDVTPLIMCPTEYNKAWANKKEGTYLDILGEQLHPAIQVMWTGNSVVADNTTEGLEWVNKRIRRPAFVWWNFPVSDYVRDHLLLGAAYGLDSDAAPHLSGFVSNPMDKAEASKPDIFSIANYSWNMKAYDAQKTWQAALQSVMPEAPDAFAIFAEHNSDLGPNGHRYRREESVAVRPLIDSFLKAYRNHQFSRTLSNQIEAEFERMLPVANTIMAKSKNKRLVEQIEPWLLQFDLLARAGVQALQMSNQWQDKNYAASWRHYLQLGALLGSMNTVDKTLNQNPYQPGVETGSLVLTPFVKELYGQTGRLFETGGRLQSGAAAEAQLSTLIYTNTEKLRHQPLRISNELVSISPVLEVVTLQPGEYVGLQLHPGLKPTALHLNLESNSLQKEGRFEASADGQQWNPFAVEEKRGKGTFKDLKEGVRFIRFINHSGKPLSFYLKEMRLNVAPANEGAASVFALDGSIHTMRPFTKDSALRLPLPALLLHQPLTIFLQTNGSPFVITGISAKGKRKVLFRGSADFVQVKKSKNKKWAALEFTTEAAAPLMIYEVVPWGK